VVTGSRAEYGLLQSTLQAITHHPRLELQLVVTGMHLLPKFGRTIDDIRRDEWPIAVTVAMQTGSDAALDQAEGLARGVAGMARFFESAATDVVMVLGDRIEAMAGALAGALTGRIVAHVHGGDVAPGDFDDSLRHAITKLGHLHLAATRDAAQRIIRMGERRQRVFVVGAPGIDRLGELVAQHGIIPSGARLPLAVVAQHPCGRSAAHERATMAAILRAVRHARLNAWVVYPNSDRGHSGIIAAIQAAHAASRNGEFRAVRSVPRDEYLRQLLRARVLIGNSSSGIIEAASAAIPAVNVGARQAGRLRSGASVLDCAENYAAIRQALQRALGYRFRSGSANTYGKGQVGQRIAKILARVRLDETVRRKQIAY
jgi:UDP-hydrolysing UDP-N-acetyl-D-glucosamine 2-epimerase